MRQVLNFGALAAALIGCGGKAPPASSRPIDVGVAIAGAANVHEAKLIFGEEVAYNLQEMLRGAAFPDILPVPAGETHFYIPVRVISSEMTFDDAAGEYVYRRAQDECLTGIAHVAKGRVFDPRPDAQGRDPLRVMRPASEGGRAGDERPVLIRNDDDAGHMMVVDEVTRHNRVAPEELGASLTGLLIQIAETSDGYMEVFLYMVPLVPGEDGKPVAREGWPVYGLGALFHDSVSRSALCGG